MSSPNQNAAIYEIWFKLGENGIKKQKAVELTRKS
jgi:hypothetical protein